MGFLNDFIKNLDEEKTKKLEDEQKNREEEIEKIMKKYNIEKPEAILIYEGINEAPESKEE